MSKRLTRKQIKEDIRHGELQTAVSTTYEKLHDNQRLIVGVLVAVLTLAIGFALIRVFAAQRSEAAARDLAAAVEVYEAPISAEGADGNGAAAAEGPRFASDEERRTEARTALQAVGGGAAEDVAGLYLADLALREGDKAAARKHWEAYLDDHGDHLLAVSVRLNLIRLDREEGKGEEVVERLEAELVETEPDLPQDVLLFELAKTLDTLGRGEAAREYYQRILDDHPQSPHAAEAREKTTG